MLSLGYSGTLMLAVELTMLGNRGDDSTYHLSIADDVHLHSGSLNYRGTSMGAGEGHR